MEVRLANMRVYFMHALKLTFLLHAGSNIKFLFFQFILFFKLMVEVNFSDRNFPCKLFFVVSISIFILELN